MSRIQILDLSTHSSNDNSEIGELSEQELHIKGGLLAPILLLFANPFA
ncbi:MAG: hypothetical protein QNJ33_03345 [Crocosphaera sp.]|nr:hypothetical protein [Crocosphaera sp.]